MILHRLLEGGDDPGVVRTCAVVREHLVRIESGLGRHPLDLAVRGGDPRNVCPMPVVVHGVTVVVGEVIPSHHLRVGEPGSAQVRMGVVDTGVDDADGRPGAVQLLSRGRRSAPQSGVDAHGRVGDVIQEMRRLRLVHERNRPCSRHRRDVASGDGQCQAIQHNGHALVHGVRDPSGSERSKESLLLAGNSTGRRLCLLCLQPPRRSRIVDPFHERLSIQAHDDLLGSRHRRHTVKKGRIHGGRVDSCRSSRPCRQTRKEQRCYHHRAHQPP